MTLTSNQQSQIMRVVCPFLSGHVLDPSDPSTPGVVLHEGLTPGLHTHRARTKLSTQGPQLKLASMHPNMGKISGFFILKRTTNPNFYKTK